MIDWLDEFRWPEFPDTSRALEEPEGLLAAGGHLSPTWLDFAYRKGIFPWNDTVESNQGAELRLGTVQTDPTAHSRDGSIYYSTVAGNSAIATILFV